MTKDFPTTNFPFEFLHGIRIQDKNNKLAVKAESGFLMCDALPIHTYTHFQSAISTSAPYKLSLTPHRGDPCQTCVTFGGRGYRSIHTHSLFSICLFMCLCRFIFWCLPSSCLSSALRLGHSQMSCLETCHLWRLCSQVSMSTEVLDFTCLQIYSLLSFTNLSEFHFETFFIDFLPLLSLSVYPTETCFISGLERNRRKLLNSKSWEAVPLTGFWKSTLIWLQLKTYF